MSDTLTVLVAGGINVDEILWLPHAPTDDGSVQVTRRHRSFGGHAANCAVALARLGADVTLAGAVGADEEGRACLQHLRAEGVDTAHVLQAPDRLTGKVIIPQAPGLRFMLMDRGANDAVDAGWLDSLHPGSFDVIVIFDPPDAVRSTLVARSGPRQRLVWSPGGLRAARGGCAAELSAFDQVVFNRAEAFQWFGEDPAADGFAGRGEVDLSARAGEVYVTLGAEGSLSWGGEGRVAAPAFPAKVTDETGAGDAFVAGLVRASGAAAQRLAFANLVGGMATEGAGAQGGLPSLEAVIARAKALGLRLDGRGP
jgi:ribokinase